MSLFDDITKAKVPPNEELPEATPEVAAILKASDLAAEPMDLRVKGRPPEFSNAPLEMPRHVYRHTRKKLTQIVMREICDAIRGGAMDHVAAAAAGIDQEKFDHFMRTFPLFRSNVEQAHAQCRAQLEQDVAKKKPLDWLLKGPGREKPGKPGWTAQTSITGADGGKVQHEVKHTVNLDRLTEGQLEQMKQLMEKTETKPDVVDAEFSEVDPKPK